MSHPTIHTKTLPNGFSFDMIYVEGGTFMMGDDNGEYDDEKPAHEVTVGSYWMGKYPVTQGLWKAVMGKDNNPSYFPGDLRPVERISWYDAVEFCNQLSGLLQLPLCYQLSEVKRDDSGQITAAQVERDPHATGYRLPTEAEWEYAAKGGKPGQQDGTAQMRYAGSSIIKEVAWLSENSHRETKEVGLKQPNSLNLYDISGNVSEWCEDWKKGYPDSRKVDDWTGTYRMLRGGSWISSTRSCRPVRRIYTRPRNQLFGDGLRLTRSS